MKVLKTFRVFRIFKMFRYLSSLRIIGEVILVGRCRLTLSNTR
jgi:hypothetical protein